MLDQKLKNYLDQSPFGFDPFWTHNCERFHFLPVFQLFLGHGIQVYWVSGQGNSPGYLSRGNQIIQGLGDLPKFSYDEGRLQGRRRRHSSAQIALRPLSFEQGSALDNVNIYKIVSKSQHDAGILYVEVDNCL